WPRRHCSPRIRRRPRTRCARRCRAISADVPATPRSSRLCWPPRRVGSNVRLTPFTLVEPESLSEALAAVARLDGEARVVSGGTALVSMIRLGLIKPDRLVSLHRIPGMAEIRTDGAML